MTKIFVLVLVALCRFDVSSAAMSVDDMVDVMYQCDPNGRNKKSGPPPCFEGITETLVLMAKDQSNSLDMDGVYKMLDYPRADKTAEKMYYRRDVVKYMVSTLIKDYGRLEFSDKFAEFNKRKKSMDESQADAFILVDQLLRIKTKHFELFRYAIFNVLLKLAPVDTFGRVQWQLECPDWTDACLQRLGERRDLLGWIIWRLIREDEGAPITTKEHIQELFDTVLNGHITTVDPKNELLLSLLIKWGRLIIWFVQQKLSYYSEYVILAIVAVSLLTLLKKKKTGDPRDAKKQSTKSNKGGKEKKSSKGNKKKKH